MAAMRKIRQTCGTAANGPTRDDEEGNAVACFKHGAEALGQDRPRTGVR